MKQANCCFCGRSVADRSEMILLLDRVICAACERMLVEASVDDEIYDALKDKIKNLWFG